MALEFKSWQKVDIWTRFPCRAYAEDTRASRELSTGLRFLRALFILLGVFLVGVSVSLPILFRLSTVHISGSGRFGSNYLVSLMPIITIASMASSFIAILVILSFERATPNRATWMVGLLTFLVIAVEVGMSIWFSVARPLSSTVLPLIYVLMELVPFGLACTMFTLATIVSHKP